MKIVRPINAKDVAQDVKLDIKQMKRNSAVIISIYLVLILFGLGTGYLLANKGSRGTSEIITNNASGGIANIVGVKDASKYTNCPIGTLEKGGLDGEGTHHLIRPGGPSQTAYVVSSIIDLDQYVGLSVKLCGATMQAQKAPWLMDVERLEVQGK